MNQDQIQSRFWLLTDCLEKCTKKKDDDDDDVGIFTLVERIFINQERGQLLQGKDHYQQDAMLALKIKKNK